jgi:pantoate--beta-alanine ligase
MWARGLLAQGRGGAVAGRVDQRQSAMEPEIVRSVAALRRRLAAWRRAGASIGMVPTMGALHAGHLALVREAKRQTDRTVATLFVNPTQFGAGEDLAAYPRDEAADARKLAALDVELLFAPPVAEMYPAGFDTRVLVGGPSAGLESEFRPHFFAAVATVVAKLLLAGLPDRAFFGEKDYQQLLVVRQLVRDLNIPTEIVGCPTVREPDGLALSSRNAYLGAEDRARAAQLYAVLSRTADGLRSGAAHDEVLADARRALAAAGFRVDYVEARNADTLAPVGKWGAEPLRLLAAARLGRTRLIDNVPV